MASSYTPTTDFLMSHAQRALTEANNAESRISGAAKPSLSNPKFTHTVNKPVVAPPPTFADMFEGADSSDATLQWLDAQTQDWLTAHFPNINGCLKTLPDQWLCDVIGGARPFGHSQTYFDLVWHQARDRANRTRRSEIDSIDAQFSGRGFSLPPGAYAAAIDQAEQRASDSVLEVNREQALKDADIKLDLLKFAEQQALQYKTGIMQLLGDFYRQWSTLPDKDIERARIRAQAMSSLYSALSNYYNVEVSFEQLRLRAAETKVDTEMGVDKNKIALFGADTSANTALGAAVRGFADISAAAANAAGTLVAQIEAV